MTRPTGTTRLLTLEDFARDSHAAKYVGELEIRRDATRQLFAILNDPANEQRLVDAEMHDLPALCGVVRFLEADVAVETVLASGSSGYRFRQTVGVAVRLKMERLGWTGTGRKGVVRGARYFTKAEHYTSGQDVDGGYAEQALATLSGLEHIGDDEERRDTGQYLMAALATTRAAEGRVF